MGQKEVEQWLLDGADWKQKRRTWVELYEGRGWNCMKDEGGTV